MVLILRNFHVCQRLSGICHLATQPQPSNEYFGVGSQFKSQKPHLLLSLRFFSSSSFSFSVQNLGKQPVLPLVSSHPLPSFFTLHRQHRRSLPVFNRLLPQLAAPSLSSTASFPNSPPTASPPAGSTVRVPPTSSSAASSQPPPAPSPDSSSSPPFPYFFPKPSSSVLSSGLFFSPPPRFPASVLRCSRSTAIASSPSPFLLHHLPIFGAGLLLVPPPSSDSHRRLHLFRRFDSVSLLSADDECRRPRLPVGDLGVRKSVQTFRGFEARSPHSPSRRRRPPLRRSTTPTVPSLLLLSVLPHQHRRLLFSSEHHRPPPPFSSSSPPPPLVSAHRCCRCDLEPQPKPEIGGKKMALLGLIGW